MPWLTGDAIPEDFFCRVIRVPNDPTFIQAVNGALLDLAYVENWEQHGTLTPEQVAEKFDEIYIEYTQSSCDVTPIGALMMFAADSQPEKWLICDGAAVSRSTYADLFAVIGTNYGAGNGTTTFNIPDFRDLSPMGSGGNFVGQPGAAFGEYEHTLTVFEMPTHNHAVSDPGHVHPPLSPSTTFLGNKPSGTNTAPASTFLGTAATTGSATTGIGVDNTGGGLPHNNIHPVMGTNFLIYTGVV